MNRTNFFDGMDVSADDLQYSQAALIQQIKNSRTDIIGKGVLSDVSDYVQLDPATLSDGTPTIRILPFSAYTNTGERIETTLVYGLALDLTDSTNRQLGTQGTLPLEDFGWENGITYQICVKYIERGARPLPQDTTAIPFASRIYSGFEFYALRKGVDSLIVDGTNPYIILAEATYTESEEGKVLQITNSGITQYSSISGTKVGTKPSNIKTQAYDPQNLDNSANPNAITLDDHIHAISDITAVSATNPHGITAKSLGVDTKSVPNHEKLFHSNGLLAGAAGVSTTISGFYTTVIPQSSSVDLLRVYNLASDELLHYKGATLRYFINSTINSVNISLADTQGTWSTPNDVLTVKLYVSTATNNLFIAVPNGSTALNRKYTIYDSATNNVLTTASPISESSVNEDIHYLLYTFIFSNTKGASALYSTSNFLSVVDNRTFGSISADNLQRDSKNIFTFPYPVKVSELQFSSDNSTITSSNGILKYTNISNCVLSAPNGVFTVGTGSEAGKIIIPAGLSLLCAYGLTADKTCNSIYTTYITRRVSSGAVPIVEGKWYIFVGAPQSGSTQDVFFADEYLVSDQTPSQVSGTSACWYNPDINEIRFWSGSSWGEALPLALLGYAEVNNFGNITKANPNYPIRVFDYISIQSLIENKNILYSLLPSSMDFVVQSWTSGTDWYRVYRSGWVEQGGAYFINLSNPQTVSLFVSMADNNYAVSLVKCQNSNEPGAQSVSIVNDSKTTTSFKVYGNDGSSTRRMYAFYWQIKGWKA